MAEENELEHFERIDKMMKRMVESLRRSREMHDNLAHKMDMARTDAADELIREVEDYLAGLGN
jgi:DNA repair ATPase RecN